LRVANSWELCAGLKYATDDPWAGGAKKLAFEQATRNKHTQVTRIHALSTKHLSRAGKRIYKGKILAENGGLEVALDPDGVLGIWKAGA